MPYRNLAAENGRLTCGQAAARGRRRVRDTGSDEQALCSPSWSNIRKGLEREGTSIMSLLFLLSLPLRRPTLYITH